MTYAIDWPAVATWNRQIRRAIYHYHAHPIVTPSYPCATCNGHSYGPGGQCIPCRKEGIPLE